ncbi:MAG: tyrosine-type recombinase/integrase [Alphaproteobacteria bacterium]|nr:tyrosine-type recombinase/integrase [Alphaproteobacteria bacterium]
MKKVLTDKFISSYELLANEKRIEICDERCPYLRVRISENNKSFIVLKKMRGQSIRVTIGKFGEIGIDVARQKAIEILKQINDGINPNVSKYEMNKEITLDELFKEFMERYAKVMTTEKHWKANQRYYDRFFEKLGKKRLSDITTRQIEYIVNSVKENNGLYTANHVLILIRHLYNKAIKWGWNGKNPTNPISKFKTYARERFLLPEELKRLFKVLDEESSLYFKTFFYVLLYTGQRCGNVREMRWDNINFDTGIWYIPMTKNGTSMRVPLVEQLYPLLKNLKKITGSSEWVFPMRDHPENPMNEPKHHWEKIRIKAKIKDVRIHDLRRTLATWECMSGVNLAIVSKTLNHKSLQSTQVYARADTTAISQALQATVNNFNQFRDAIVDDI